MYEGPRLRNSLRENDAGGETKPNYIGMNGTSLHARGVSHQQSVRSRNTSNALALHIRDAHAGVEQQFSMDACTSHRTVMTRYKTEGVYIEHQSVGTSLNSRMEEGCGGLV